MVAGVKDKIWLINLEDIDKDSCVFKTGDELVLESIILNTASPAKTAFTLEGKNYSNDYDVALVKGKYNNAYDHNLMFRIFDNDPDVKNWVHNACNGAKFVIVVENNYNNKSKVGTPGDSVFEVLGWELGLEISEATRNTIDADTKGGWVLKATCDETNKEPLPPLTFFKTDLATTRGLLDALV